jgi:hypothetical protein
MAAIEKTRRALWWSGNAVPLTGMSWTRVIPMLRLPTFRVSCMYESSQGICDEFRCFRVSGKFATAPRVVRIQSHNQNNHKVTDPVLPRPRAPGRIEFSAMLKRLGNCGSLLLPTCGATDCTHGSVHWRKDRHRDVPAWRFSRALPPAHTHLHAYVTTHAHYHSHEAESKTSSHARTTGLRVQPVDGAGHPVGPDLP